MTWIHFGEKVVLGEVHRAFSNYNLITSFAMLLFCKERLLTVRLE